MTSIVMFNKTECPVFKYSYKTLDKIHVALQENTYTYIYILTHLYVYVLGSQFIRKFCLHRYKSVTKLHRNECKHFLKVKMPFTGIQVNFTEQDLLLCVINHVACHWTLLVQKSVTYYYIITTSVHKTGYRLQPEQAEYFDSYKGSVYV